MELSDTVAQPALTVNLSSLLAHAETQLESTAKPSAISLASLLEEPTTASQGLKLEASPHPLADATTENELEAERPWVIDLSPMLKVKLQDPMYVRSELLPDLPASPERSTQPIQSEEKSELSPSRTWGNASTADSLDARSPNSLIVDSPSSPDASPKITSETKIEDREALSAKTKVVGVHPTSCKPCNFFCRRKCQWGDACEFCHDVSHVDQWREMKTQRQARRPSKWEREMRAMQSVPIIPAGALAMYMPAIPMGALGPIVPR